MRRLYSSELLWNYVPVMGKRKDRIQSPKEGAARGERQKQTVGLLKKTSPEKRNHGRPLWPRPKVALFFWKDTFQKCCILNALRIIRAILGIPTQNHILRSSTETDALRTGCIRGQSEFPVHSHTNTHTRIASEPLGSASARVHVSLVPPPPRFLAPAAAAAAVLCFPPPPRFSFCSLLLSLNACLPLPPHPPFNGKGIGIGFARFRYACSVGRLKGSCEGGGEE